MPPPPLPLLLLLQLVEAGDAASYAAGTREAALHAMAGRHPNIVPLLDALNTAAPPAATRAWCWSAAAATCCM